jgi:Ca2+-binding EF-hand superfamily protein
MQDMFKSMDLDGAGKIRWEQARVVMAKMGRKMTDDQFAKLVDRYDIDKNGIIFHFRCFHVLRLMHPQAIWNFQSFALCT